MCFVFKKLNFEKWLWVNAGINRMPDVHVVQRYMDTLKAFSVEDDGSGLDFFIPERERVNVQSLPSHFSQGYIALALGGAHIGKRMDAEKLIRVCASIPHPIVLLGGAEDRETGDAIVNALGDKIVNRAGVYSIHQSADLLRQSRIVISGDTGLMHIASAFGKKIISIWGCTVPGLGMAPWRAHPDSVIIEPEGRKKRPCSKLGNRCKYGEDNRCIQAVSEDSIRDAVQRLW